MCGKCKGTHDDDVERQDIDRDSNDDDDIEWFDGFAGDFNINNILYIEPVYQHWQVVYKQAVYKLI